MANSEKIGAKKEIQSQKKDNIVTKTVTFFNKYQKIVYGILIGLMVVILAILAFNKFYLKPKNERGAALIVKPIEYYSRGFQMGDTASFNLALEGDDENEGFIDIASGYKMTKVGNSAKYFAGLCYLQMGEKQDALDYFLKFRKKENVYWYNCQALIGDIYDDEGDSENAIKYYKKAVKGDNPYFTPNNLFKLAQMYERNDNWESALEAYQRIESEFYQQYQLMGIDRYLERAKINASK